jgi:PAS domain S-box-containing protein
VLGADAETQYEAVAVVPLRPGDLLVLSTDGTTEARDRATRRFFGYEGLTAAAEEMARSSGQTSPTDAAQEIVARAKEFAGGSLGDDACVLVARFTGAPGGARARDESGPRGRTAGTAVASEERYRAFVENSSEGIWRFDLEEAVPVVLPEGEQIDAFYRDGFLAEANDAFARMYGFERGADLVGARVGDLLLRDDPANVAYLSAFVRSGYRLSDVESVEKDRDGNVRYFSNTLTGIVEDGRLVRAWGTQRDVTGLRVSADALRASEARYRELFEGHPQPMWVFDAASLAVLDVNEAAVRHYGYSREEFLTMTVTQLRPAEDVARFEAFVPSLATMPHQKMGTWRHKKKDGAVIDVEVASSPIVYDGRRPARIVAVTDVTDRLTGERARREAEERLKASVDALRASEDRYRTLFETATVGIVYQDEQAAILDANPAAQRILGLTLDQMQGRTSMDPRWHAVREDGGPLPGEEHPVPRALRSGRVERGEMGVFHSGEGTYRWIDVTAVPQSPDAQGRPRLIYALFEDITERRQAERERAASEERFRALADNIAQLAWMADPSGSTFWYNRRWFEYTGTTPEEMVGWGWKSVHDPERVEQVADRFRAHVEAAQPWEDTFPLRGKDGAFRWFLSRAFPIRDASGKITLWCGTNTDVTEQREAAQKQRRFLKEMLAGFTEGRLRLCFAPEELPAPLSRPDPGPLSLPDESALRGLRRCVGEAVAALGLPSERAQGFATAVHEAARERGKVRRRRHGARVRGRRRGHAPGVGGGPGAWHRRGHDPPGGGARLHHRRLRARDVSHAVLRGPAVPVLGGGSGHHGRAGDGPRGTRAGVALPLARQGTAGGGGGDGGLPRLHEDSRPPSRYLPALVLGASGGGAKVRAATPPRTTNSRSRPLIRSRSHSAPAVVGGGRSDERSHLDTVP